METQQKEYTFEQRFEMLAKSFENARIEMDRMSAEADKRKIEWEERFKKNEEAADKRKVEADKRAEEADKSMAELKRIVKENSSEIGGISKSNGEVAEDTVYNSLEQNMTFAGISFDFIARNWKKHSKKLDLECEFDVILENGDTIALIETKYKVRKKDVSELLTKEVADKFRKLFPLYKDYKILLGIGGMGFEKEAIDEAKENGVGIIKIVGDNVEYYTEGIKVY
jgi:hypothetical protein